MLLEIHEIQSEHVVKELSDPFYVFKVNVIKELHVFKHDFHRFRLVIIRQTMVPATEYPEQTLIDELWRHWIHLLVSRLIERSLRRVNQYGFQLELLL